MHVRALLPETGRNFDLHTTIRWALSQGLRISMWGPYRIEPALYDRALEQIRVLESGRVKYKVVDTGWPDTVAVNCIHPIDTAVRRGRCRVPSTSFGETASYYLVRRMQPWFLDEPRQDWVSAWLGLAWYPIIPRELENPRSSFLWSKLHWATGEDEDADGSGSKR